MAVVLLPFRPGAASRCVLGVLPREVTLLSSRGAFLFTPHTIHHLPLVQFLVFRSVVVGLSVKTGKPPLISTSELVSLTFAKHMPWLQAWVELPWHINEHACMRVVT